MQSNNVQLFEVTQCCRMQILSMTKIMYLTPKGELVHCVSLLDAYTASDCILQSLRLFTARVNLFVYVTVLCICVCVALS